MSFRPLMQYYLMCLVSTLKQKFGMTVKEYLTLHVQAIAELG